MMLKNRKRICIILAVATVISLAIGWYLTMRPGVFLAGEFLYRKDADHFESFSHDFIVREGDHYEIKCHDKSDSVDLEVTGDYYSFVFPKGKNVSGTRVGDTLYDADGLPVELNWIMNDGFSVGGWDAYNSTPRGASHYEIAEKVMLLHDGKTEIRGDMLTSLPGILLTLIGAILLLWPEESYTFLNEWFYKKVELSAAGIAFRQLGGILFLILGFLFTSGLFVMMLT